MTRKLMTLGLLLLTLPAVALAADPKAGEALFNSRACAACHAIGKTGSAATGPNLLGVTKRRPLEWIGRWIANPDAMRADAVIVQLRGQFPSDMPNLGLSPDDVQSLLLYLKSNDQSR